MRLIDADAEILKIEAEIKQYEKRMQQWEDNAEDRSLYDVDLKIRELEYNITECKIEIKMLRMYKTVSMEAHDKKIRDKVIEEFAEKMKNVAYQWFEHGTMAIGMIDEVAEQMTEV